jgi:low temperature requirement protein LtrA
LRRFDGGYSHRVSASERQLVNDLRDNVRHRVRPMTGRDPDERSRSTAPVELLYDLTYVVAFGAAAEQLAHHLVAGQVGSSIGAYLFAVFAVTWAWLNYTWFASAYGNDDVVFRVATIVQMIGVVILIFGLPLSFDAAARGESPNNMVLVSGYLIMRVPLLALWLRAAQHDRERRGVALGYAATIALAQVGWVLSAVLALPPAIAVGALMVLAAVEMSAPALLERRLGRPPWNAGHVAERFNLLTLITLGEVIAATTAAVGALVGSQGWSLAALAVVSAGLVLTAALWWAYFLIPSRVILEHWPERTMPWRYVHLPMFGAIAAVGAGLRVAAAAVEHRGLTLVRIALYVGVPVGCVLATVFLIWSVLMRARDVSHVPLFAVSLMPVAGAVAVGPPPDPSRSTRPEPPMPGRWWWW